MALYRSPDYQHAIFFSYRISPPLTRLLLYQSRVSGVLLSHIFLMNETIKLCPVANKMMLCYAIS